MALWLILNEIWKLKMKTPVKSVALWLNAHCGAVVAAMAACGLLLRFREAATTYLNPDEAWHVLLAVSPQTHGVAGLMRAAMDVSHPPVLIVALKVVACFGRSEVTLRLIPVVAGTLFPVFVMLWVRRLAGCAAGICAAATLLFSPALIGLSAEVRSYTLALLFTSIALWLLDVALDRSSVRYLAAFHGFLYLAILADFCVVWAVATMGVYALCRLIRDHAPGRVWLTWSVGQALALAIYVVLLITQASRFAHSFESDLAIKGWLRDFYLQQGESVARFVGRTAMGPFEYLLGTVKLGWLGAAGALIGVYQAWRRSWHVALALALPLPLAMTGALLRLLPYGASRHCAALSIFIAAGIGIGAVAFTRHRIAAALAGTLLFMGLANMRAGTPIFTTPVERHRLSDMRSAIDFLRSHVPVGSVVVTDQGTDLMLVYYLHAPYQKNTVYPYSVREAGGYHLFVAPTFEFQNETDLRETMAEAKRRFHLEGPVWVAAGGISLHVKTPPSQVKSFSEAVTIFPWTGDDRGGNPPPAERRLWIPALGARQE